PLPVPTPSRPTLRNECMQRSSGFEGRSPEPFREDNPGPRAVWGVGMMRRMGDGLRIQLWSAHYEPEPTGIGPMSRTFVDALRSRGHDVEVIAAHPHYPDP